MLRRVRTHVEFFIKLRIVIIIDVLIDNVLTEVKIVFGTDGFTIEGKTFLPFYLSLECFVALQFLDGWLICKHRSLAHRMFCKVLLHARDYSRQSCVIIGNRIDATVNDGLCP